MFQQKSDLTIGIIADRNNFDCIGPVDLIDHLHRIPQGFTTPNPYMVVDVSMNVLNEDHVLF